MRHERQDLRGFIDDLKSRVDIVATVSPHVQLKRQGKVFKGLCPFHKEDTPSFVVYPERRNYHCYGCGEHGDVLKFLQRLRFGDDFIATLKALGEEHGMPLPSSGKGADHHQRHRELLQAAVDFYRKLLQGSKEQMAYLLEERGISKETVDRFEIGYVPDDWQALERLFKKDYTDPVLQEVGLVGVSEKGNRYDVFRGRIMFPIRDLSGNLRGFGGRTVVGSDAKYLNSPDSRLFNKRWLLYGAHQALPAIRERRSVVVVEGYMDVVVLADRGIGNAVASMGTAVTPEQMSLAARHADSVVFCFDGDEAGRRAAGRGLENILPSLADGKEVSFMFLPEGEDPDSHVRKAGKDGFLGLASGAKPLAEFLAEWAGMADRSDAGDAARVGRMRVAAEMVERIDRQSAPFLRESIYALLAEKTGISAGGLKEAAHTMRAESVARNLDRSPLLFNRDGPLYRILACLNRDPGLVLEVEDIPILGDQREVELFHDICAWIERESPGPMMLSEHLVKAGYRRLAKRLTDSAVRFDGPDMDVRNEFEAIGDKFREISRDSREMEDRRRRLKEALGGQ